MNQSNHSSSSRLQLSDFTVSPNKEFFSGQTANRYMYFIICACPEPLELQQTLHTEGLDEGKVVVQSQTSRYLARSCRRYYRCRSVQLQRDVICADVLRTYMYVSVPVAMRMPNAMTRMTAQKIPSQP